MSLLLSSHAKKRQQEELEGKLAHNSDYLDKMTIMDSLSRRHMNNQQ
ncbi:10090_t:CDS:2 [Entrophospora sp. SA101]|nr:10090_t:CDS:2 [Entrophospora sp. SA101]